MPAGSQISALSNDILNVTELSGIKLGPGEWAPDPNNRPGLRVTEHWTVAAETPQARRRSTVENCRMSAKMTIDNRKL